MVTPLLFRLAGDGLHSQLGQLYLIVATYAIDHLVSYNGAIYKNITGTNTDTAPGVDLLLTGQ